MAKIFRNFVILFPGLKWYWQQG